MELSGFKLLSNHVCICWVGDGSQARWVQAPQHTLRDGGPGVCRIQMTWSRPSWVCTTEGPLGRQTGKPDTSCLERQKGKAEKKNQSAEKIRGADTTGHLEEVRRMGIFPEPLAREPVEWKGQPRQQSGRQEHGKGQPLDGLFFLEPSVEDKEHA